ncbi:MAG: hypothetical protein NW201_11485 [Gemmatimonadales bacterium]|nr:hypothetical protein [Gemmatimonadales bacterium]
MKHPTIEIPDVGPMDHAWDVLGDWAAEMEWHSVEATLRGALRVASWTEAELRLEPAAATAVGAPVRLALQRTGPVERTEAGGGALEWPYEGPDARWRLRATMWPGEIVLFVRDAIEGEELGRVRARRGAAYYTEKYP